MADEPGKSKLFIDEDWKSQVQAEKEAAKHSEPAKPAADTAGQQGEIPEPSLPSLVISLATQAMGALGLLAGPDGQPLPAEPEYAKYLIDTIGMLDVKTKGNQTAEESAMFEDALHQLRMTFVAVTSQQ
jgi:hypothetical protein